jgi:YD repeat-containing protein
MESACGATGTRIWDRHRHRPRLRGRPDQLGIGCQGYSSGWNGHSTGDSQVTSDQPQVITFPLYSPKSMVSTPTLMTVKASFIAFGQIQSSLSTTFTVLPFNPTFSISPPQFQGGQPTASLVLDVPTGENAFGLGISVNGAAAGDSFVATNSQRSCNVPCSLAYFPVPSDGRTFTYQIAPSNQITQPEIVTLTTDWGGGFGGSRSAQLALPDVSADIGSSAPPSGCEGTCGLPINLRSGDTWIENQDYALPGLGGGITVKRTWNSMWSSTSPPNQVGMFGDSWISNYEEAIQVVPNSQAKYWRADGSAWTLTWNSSNQQYTVTSPPDEHATLTFNTSTTLFTLTFPDGRTEIFSNPGRLQSVADRNGNKTTLTYDAQNRVTQATDAAGRVLIFNYAGSTFPNQVSSIQDSVGTVATYSYSTGGFLSSVTYADGSVDNFSYDSNGLILSVTDATGKIIESHTYDALRRGLTSQRAGGVDLVTANYNPGTAQLSDSNGNTTNYGITAVGTRRLVSSISGPGCDTCIGRGNWSYTYDGQGNRTQAVDPLGHFTNFGYDTNGNVTSKKSR